MTKQERFTEAFNYLKSKGLAHTQKDVADKMGATPPNVSSALKGVESVLTDKFLLRFNSSYSSIFQELWLLTGEGDMLKTPTTQINQTNHGTMAVGINNGTAHIPSPSPPGTDNLYKMCLEMTREAKETHQMAVDILKSVTDMISLVYGVSDAIKRDRENIQKLFCDLREARDKNVEENNKFLDERRAAFSEWVEEQKELINELAVDFADSFHKQTREAERNVNASTEKIVHASTQKIVQQCKSVDLTELKNGMKSLLLYHNMSRGADTTSGNA